MNAYMTPDTTLGEGGGGEAVPLLGNQKRKEKYSNLPQSYLVGLTLSCYGNFSLSLRPNGNLIPSPRLYHGHTSYVYRFQGLHICQHNADICQSQT